MRSLFHFMVTAEMAASQSVFEWPQTSDSQKEPYQDYRENASVPERSLGGGRKQTQFPKRRVF
jgi:hypothetical protein